MPNAYNCARGGIACLKDSSKLSDRTPELPEQYSKSPYPPISLRRKRGRKDRVIVRLANVDVRPRLATADRYILGPVGSSVRRCSPEPPLHPPSRTDACFSSASDRAGRGGQAVRCRAAAKASNRIMAIHANQNGSVRDASNTRAMMSAE